MLQNHAISSFVTKYRGSICLYAMRSKPLAVALVFFWLIAVATPIAIFHAAAYVKFCFTDWDDFDYLIWDKVIHSIALAIMLAISWINLFGWMVWPMYVLLAVFSWLLGVDDDII